MNTRILGRYIQALAVLSLVPAAFAQFSFTPVGDLPGGTIDSQVRATNETGTIAVGSGTERNSTAGFGNGDTPFYWTSGGGLVELPSGVSLTNPVFSPFITASDLTPDGSIVAGRVRLSNSNNQRVAALWTNSGTTLNTLGFIPGAALNLNTFSAATALSNDGTVAYGFGSSPTPGTVQQAFKWTAATGVVGLGFLNPTDTSSLVAGRATSADGTEAAGTSGTGTFGPGGTAFLYKDGSGMQSLGYLAGGTWSAALGVSADGTTVMGVADSASAPGGELFSWTQAGGMVGLGDAGFGLTNVGGINSDGTIIVDGDTLHNSMGLSDIQLILAGAGLNVAGWSNFATFGISDNGDVLYGSALDPLGNTEGWVATFADGYLETATSQSVPDSGGSALLLMLALGGLGATRACRARGQRQTQA